MFLCPYNRCSVHRSQRIAQDLRRAVCIFQCRSDQSSAGSEGSGVLDQGSCRRRRQPALLLQIFRRHMIGHSLTTTAESLHQGRTPRWAAHDKVEGHSPVAFVALFSFDGQPVTHSGRWPDSSGALANTILQSGRGSLPESTGPLSPGRFRPWSEQLDLTILFPCPLPWQLQLSYADTHPMYSDENYPNFFRVVPSEAAFNPAMVSLLKHLNWTRVGSLYQTDPRHSLVSGSAWKETDCGRNGNDGIK